MDLERLSRDYDLNKIIKNINALKIIEAAQLISNGTKTSMAYKEAHISRQTITRELGKSLYFCLKGNPNYENKNKGKKNVDKKPAKKRLVIKSGTTNPEDPVLNNLINSSKIKL